MIVKTFDLDKKQYRKAQKELRNRRKNPAKKQWQTI